jgi:hypothetical protein
MDAATATKVSGGQRTCTRAAGGGGAVLTKPRPAAASYGEGRGTEGEGAWVVTALGADC